MSINPYGKIFRIALFLLYSLFFYACTITESSYSSRKIEDHEYIRNVISAQRYEFCQENGAIWNLEHAAQQGSINWIPSKQPSFTYEAMFPEGNKTISWGIMPDFTLDKAGGIVLGFRGRSDSSDFTFIEDKYSDVWGSFRFKKHGQEQYSAAIEFVKKGKRVDVMRMPLPINPKYTVQKIWLVQTGIANTINIIVKTVQISKKFGDTYGNIYTWYELRIKDSTPIFNKIKDYTDVNDHFESGVFFASSNNEPYFIGISTISGEKNNNDPISQKYFSRIIAKRIFSNKQPSTILYENDSILSNLQVKNVALADSNIVLAWTREPKNIQYQIIQYAFGKFSENFIEERKPFIKPRSIVLNYYISHLQLSESKKDRNKIFLEWNAEIDNNSVFVNTQVSCTEKCKSNLEPKKLIHEQIITGIYSKNFAGKIIASGKNPQGNLYLAIGKAENLDPSKMFTKASICTFEFDSLERK